MERVFLSLGSNLGDREANLTFGRERLSKLGEVRRISSVYETKAVGNTDQPDFLNAAVEFHTDLSPEDLLDRIKSIESSAGRDLSARRWSPRPLDIDILLYGNLRIKTPRLEIPHPRMYEREFVLRPLAEISPESVRPEPVR